MKESIFFNREQIKVIRQYKIIYQGIFGYGKYIFSFLISVILIMIFAMGELFPSFSVSASPISQELYNTLPLFYQQRKQDIQPLTGIVSSLLYGNLDVKSGFLTSKGNLLSLNGVALPYFLHLSLEELERFSQIFSASGYQEQQLIHYFNKALQEPLKIEKFGDSAPQLLPLEDSLKKTFSLSCVEENPYHSFICKQYLHNFFENFPMYNIHTVADEFKKMYYLLKKQSSYREKLCSGLLRYAEYGGVLDDQFSDIIRDCGNDQYTQLLLASDFSSFQKGVALGYVDEKVYTSPLLNQYKVFSLQQLIYKQLSDSSDIKSLIQSYLAFLYKILQKESGRKVSLLGDFPKKFTYWYNNTVLMPYFKDETSKMSKEDRTSLMNEFLMLHHGNTAAGLQGLQEQVGIQTVEKISSEQDISQPVQQDLEALFKSSYLPVQFTLTSLVSQNSGTQLVVKGVDRKTNLALEVLFKFENIQLYVTTIKVIDQPKLTEYLNAFLKNEHYSFNKVLKLLADNQKIAKEEKKLDVSLCVQFEGKYLQQMTSCSEKEIVFMLGSKEDEKITYTFAVQSGVLKGVEVSDKILETELLKEINLALVDKSTSFHMIDSILKYVPKDKKSEFGLKENVLVTDKFSKYLGITPDTVVLEGDSIKVSFTVAEIKFIGTYDLVKSRLAPIAFDFGKQRKPLIIQKFELTLKDQHRETLNAFMLDPLAFIRKINARLVERYFPAKSE